MTPVRKVALALSCLLFAVGGCSLINAPDDVQPGSSGGAGPTGGTGGAPGGSGGIGGMQVECTTDEDCSMFNTECAEGDCNADGVCEQSFEDAGTPCGDTADNQCANPDTCDGSGTCAPNDEADGTFCSDCPAGEGNCDVCKGGACNDCNNFGQVNEYEGELALDGWTATGDWGLYRAAPPALSALNDEPISFPSQVIGTDGNRKSPYPGNEPMPEGEDSSLTSPRIRLPGMLAFRTWHYDEGGVGSSLDNKVIRVSLDGQTFVDVVNCFGGINSALPMCQQTDFSQARPGDAFDNNTVPLPPMFANQLGYIQFAYDTGDNCCSQEQGWFIDSTNFAAPCACQGPADCAYLDGECGTGTCGVQGVCVRTPAPGGTACGDSAADACGGADTCDGLGYCGSNDALTTTPCMGCPAGGMNCTCGAGECIDCPQLKMGNNPFNSQYDIVGWQLTGGWGIYQQAPPSPTDQDVIIFGGVLGTDGVQFPPYPTPMGMTEQSSAISTPGMMPPVLTFGSWNQDEAFDNKRIRFSTDMGGSWTVLVDCQTGVNPQVFCQDNFDHPPGFDSISIPTGGLAGQVGILEFSYDSQDGCCDFERGWFINNLNFGGGCEAASLPGM